MHGLIVGHILGSVPLRVNVHKVTEGLNVQLDRAPTLELSIPT